ncbi:MAG: lamin tail domain-containing protein [Kiritimatiellae bacterium]|nr:lamin tail domain-containing protein [Kiritimatiellia bacterium]
MEKASKGFHHRILGWAAACVFLLAATAARAVDVRIATMNLCNLKDSKPVPFASFSNIVKRVQPDILAIQEVSSSQEAALTALFATMPKPLPHRAFMPAPGTGRTTASGDKVAIFSAWPIAASAIVKENYHDPDAVEFMRWPIHAKIEVPGALNPLHVVTVHSAATTVSIPLRIHRGLEARRVREYVEERILGADENDVEYVVLGDFNDSAPGRWDAPAEAAAFQPASFTYAQFRKYETNGNFGSGADFVLGRDHPWHATNAARESFVMDYRPYPTERFGDVRPVDAFQTGTAAKWVTNWKGGDGLGIYRLDYILFSPEIMASSYGAPVAEVYYSADDSAASPGLRKPGPLPDPASSTNASDHFLVFSDFHMIDEVGGLTPVAILSELVHNPANPAANYVEICNTGNGPLDLAGYTLELYPDGSSVAAETRSLDGIVLAAGAACWLAYDTNEARRAWGTVPDAAWEGIGYADGDDAIVLRNAAGAVHDIYGAIGVDGTGRAWNYTASAASRVPGVTEPMATWHAAEWAIADVSAATPGTHLAVAEANASLTDVALRAADRDSSAPLASDDFRFAATAIPNVLASNLAMTALFRVDGGDWHTAAMTNAAGTAWLSAATNGAQSAGSSMDYYVSLAFDGPGGWSPLSSAVRSYTFPGSAAATNLNDVLINEVKTSGATNEFVELVGAAGLDLSGWKLECFTKSALSRWHCTIPDDCVIPDDGVTDKFGNPIGFFVAGTPGAPNCDFVIANTNLLADNTEKNPCMLILKNAAGAVVDAVALASTNAFVEMKLPTGVSTDVARGAANYLHCLGTSPTAAAFSLQCPDDVRTGCTDPGLYALPAWSSTNATPGKLNKNQANGALRLARVDTDADGLLDDEDNCPDTANTIQSDIDDDGYGDDCDPDMDGDAVPNEIDNCPAEYNPRQEDYDGDHVGNACDGDHDPAEWEGRTETFFLDFENVSKAYYPPTVTFTNSGRVWTLSPETIIGKTDKDKRIGAQAMRTRTNATLTLAGPLTNGLHILSFFFGRYGSNTGTPNILVEASTNDCATWETYASVPTAKAAGLTNVVLVGLGIPDGAHFRLRTDGGTSSKQLDIDNILLVSMLPVEVACELAAEITVDWNGTAHTNDFHVTPTNAVWTVRYLAEGAEESVSAPVDVGTYAATVSVQAGAAWPAAEFVFPASVTINEVQPDPVIATDETLATAVAAVLSGTVVANTTNQLDVIFEYGTSTSFGNKLWAGTVGGFGETYVDCTIENLLPDTLYYWRLHVGHAVSGPRSFTTDSLERPVAVLDGADATQALVSWTGIEGATNYILNVWHIDGAGGVSTIDVDFQDWEYLPASETSSSVKTQETAIGTWTFSGMSVYDKGAASGIGSKGFVSFRNTSAWLQFPALDRVSAIALAGRSMDGLATLKLQESRDGGATFTDVETFSLNSTTATNRHAWSAGQPAGTIFRLLRSGNRIANVHDLHITLAAAAAVPLDGMPAAVAENVFLLEGLAPSTTYYLTVKAQGRGWETDLSGELQFTTAAGDGAIPAITLPLEIPPFQVGIEGRVEFTVSGDPQPAVTIKNSSEDAWRFGFVTNSWDATAKSGRYTFHYTPDAPEPGYETQNFAMTASNAYGVHAVALPIRVWTAEDAFAQWLADRFGATSNAPAFAPAADADSDGMTTWDEYLADTCPTDAASVLKLELRQDLTTATQAVFRFASRTGRWYRLLYRTNLLSAPLTNDLGPGTGADITLRTNLDATWFGTLRVSPDAPSD